MQDNLHIKSYVKFIRSNKKFKPIKHNRYYKDGLSLQFQKNNKCSLIIPKRCGNYHIQIHLDKYFQIVKFMKIRIKKRYTFSNQI